MKVHELMRVLSRFDPGSEVVIRRAALKARRLLESDISASLGVVDLADESDAAGEPVVVEKTVSIDTWL